MALLYVVLRIEGVLDSCQNVRLQDSVLRSRCLIFLTGWRDQRMYLPMGDYA